MRFRFFAAVVLFQRSNAISCVPPTAGLLAAGLPFAGTTWSTPIPPGFAAGYTGTTFLTFSSDGARMTNNVIAVAGAVCLPIVMDQCTKATTARGGGWVDFNYTQNPLAGRFATGCLSFRAGPGGVLESSQVTLSQTCPPDGSTLPLSTSNWTRESAPGTCATASRAGAGSGGGATSGGLASSGGGPPSAEDAGVALGLGLGLGR